MAYFPPSSGRIPSLHATTAVGSVPMVVPGETRRQPAGSLQSSRARSYSLIPFRHEVWIARRAIVHFQVLSGPQRIIGTPQGLIALMVLASIQSLMCPRFLPLPWKHDGHRLACREFAHMHACRCACLNVCMSTARRF